MDHIGQTVPSHIGHSDSMKSIDYIYVKLLELKQISLQTSSTHAEARAGRATQDALRSFRRLAHEVLEGRIHNNHATDWEGIMTIDSGNDDF